jgi:hypothetical protein
VITPRVCVRHASGLVVSSNLERTAAKKSRGEELRRKILAGAVLLAKVEAGEFEEERLKQ